MYVVYILLCSDNSYYTGLTNDIEHRLWQHETGYFPNCYTAKKRPVKLVWQNWVNDSEEAIKLEKQIKGWSRKKKEALINDDIKELKRLSNLKKNNSTALRKAQGPVDFLIIGQGISGTWLSYFLEKENASFIVIDDAKPNASSRVAAGIINPVTGRRVVRTWMIETLLPFAWNTYNQLGKDLEIKAISEKTIIDFFSAPDVKIAFEKRLQEEEDFLGRADSAEVESFFHIDFGCGRVKPVYTAHLENILPAWRNKLKEKDVLLKESFDASELIQTEQGVSYNNIQAKKIIFCDGYMTTELPFFSNLPFAVHKGEALLVEIKDLPADHIYKKGLSLVPMMEKDIFWLGSNYIWEFENDLPTEAFRKEAEQKLNNWLKLPFTIIDHKASLRPATVERRPFIGMHPTHKNMGMLNGMGTKGCSLAPYFAKQFVDHLLHGTAIQPEVNINRFEKILSRS